MEKDDVELIYSILAGDEAAFSTLVKKYQKSVHALAWRKIGDFHIAEEITQDTFLQAHKKLASLKNPSQFAGMALCHRRPALQSMVPKEATKETTKYAIARSHQ